MFGPGFESLRLHLEGFHCEIPLFCKLNTGFISRQLEVQKGSRLAVVLNVNKNPFSELNYGTGKRVTTETIKDAHEPLRIRWYSDSFIKIPVLK